MRHKVTVVLLGIIFPTTGYEMPGIAWLVPPFLFMGGLMASGYLHLEEDKSIIK